MVDDERRDSEVEIHEPSEGTAERSDLAPALKVTVPEAFRREFADVMGKVRSLVEDAERGRAERASAGDLARVLEMNATLLRSVFENQQRLLGSEEKAQKLESLALSTRALNDTFRSMSKSQEALAVRLASKERSRAGILIVAFSAVAAACVLAGLFVGIVRERARTDGLRSDIASVKQEVAQVDRDRLAALAGHYEERNKSLEDEFFAGQTRLSNSNGRIEAIEARARDLERERMNLRQTLDETHATLAAAESFAKNESDRAARLAGELDTARRALDAVKDDEARRRETAASEAARESTESSPPAGTIATSPGTPKASPAGDTEDSTSPKDVVAVSTDPALLERVQADFNRLLGRSTTGTSFHLIAVAGVAPSFLQNVVVECNDGARGTPKTIEADELRITTDAAGGSVELQFKGGRLIHQGRPYPFLNGRYGIPVLGADSRDFANSTVPLSPAVASQKS